MISSTSLRIVYNELKNINVGDFPNATHDLIRSLLECALVYYLKEKDEYKLVPKHANDPNLGEMLTFVASKKCTSISDNNIKKVAKQIQSDWGKPYSLERMNMIKHNENWNSTEKEVRSAWGKIESLVKILLNPSK